jgi:hypothetical protein
MAISYAPFEDVSAPKPPIYDPLKLGAVGKVSRPEADATECNYIVMFFVIGVFLIALSDAMKSSR